MANIEKLSVTLTGEQLAALRAAVASGEYATTSEAIRDAICDWQNKREIHQEGARRLGALWDEGVASGSAGPVDMNALRDEARKRLKDASEAGN
jgi:antitoxin ParD1/3/4